MGGGGVGAVIAIAANKCDIGGDVRRVSREEVALLADSVYATHAHTGASIDLKMVVAWIHTSRCTPAYFTDVRMHAHNSGYL